MVSFVRDLIFNFGVKMFLFMYRRSKGLGCYVLSRYTVLYIYNGPPPPFLNLFFAKSDIRYLVKKRVIYHAQFYFVMNFLINFMHFPLWWPLCFRISHSSPLCNHNHRTVKLSTYNTIKI